MTIFVHIADERDTSSIKANGLRLPKRRFKSIENDIHKYGIFALPVIRDFQITHQWVRELKRRGFKTAVGVYFHVPDSELVWAGKYNEEKRLIAASESAGVLSKDRVLGYEVVVPRSILASEVRNVRNLPQVIGWRYFPDAHGKPPFCGCSYCQRGNIKSRKLQGRYEQM